MRYLIFAIGGLVIGTVMGFATGLMLGVALADLFEMSCFEGACGYFAAALALAGALIGGLLLAILGLVVARRHGYEAVPAGADRLPD